MYQAMPTVFDFRIPQRLSAHLDVATRRLTLGGERPVRTIESAAE